MSARRQLRQMPKIKDHMGSLVEPGDIIVVSYYSVFYGPHFFIGYGPAGRSLQFYDIQHRAASYYAEPRKLYKQHINVQRPNNRVLKISPVLLNERQLQTFTAVLNRINLPKLKEDYERRTIEVIDPIQNSIQQRQESVIPVTGITYSGPMDSSDFPISTIAFRDNNSHTTTDGQLWSVHPTGEVTVSVP